MGKVLEISDLFLMDDLKAEVGKLSIKIINKDNIKELCGGADNFGCKKLARACANFMVKNGICLDGEEVKQMPVVTAACMAVFKEELAACKKELEDSRGELEEMKSTKNQNQGSRDDLCRHGVHAIHCVHCHHLRMQMRFM